MQERHRRYCIGRERCNTYSGYEIWWLERLRHPKRKRGMRQVDISDQQVQHTAAVQAIKPPTPKGDYCLGSCPKLNRAICTEKTIYLKGAAMRSQGLRTGCHGSRCSSPGAPALWGHSRCRPLSAVSVKAGIASGRGEGIGSGPASKDWGQPQMAFQTRDVRARVIMEAAPQGAVDVDVYIRTLVQFQGGTGEVSEAQALAAAEGIRSAVSTAVNTKMPGIKNLQVWTRDAGACHAKCPGCAGSPLHPCWASWAGMQLEVVYMTCRTPS